MTPPSDLYELKVIVEADDWHDVSVLMASVDRALDPHHRQRGHSRRWSVVANRVAEGQARELLWFLEQFGGQAPAGPLSA